MTADGITAKEVSFLRKPDLRTGKCLSEILGGSVFGRLDTKTCRTTPSPFLFQDGDWEGGECILQPYDYEHYNQSSEAVKPRAPTWHSTKSSQGDLSPSAA